VIVYERPIRFDEVDPAGIVFFARYANFAHEAVENFFAVLDGGYAALIQKRRIGLPIVHLEADFRAPLRYGDSLRIESRCDNVGTSSASFAHDIRDALGGKLAATVRHVVVAVDLDTFESRPLPDDVRAALEAHR
jgi:4-hydroxybenzoyl-CoA thioesterase